MEKKSYTEINFALSNKKHASQEGCCWSIMHRCKDIYRSFEDLLEEFENRKLLQRQTIQTESSLFFMILAVAILLLFFNSSMYVPFCNQYKQNFLVAGHHRTCSSFLAPAHHIADWLMAWRGSAGVGCTFHCVVGQGGVSYTGTSTAGCSQTRQ